MGNVSSHSEDGCSLYLRDQNRFSINSLTITNWRRRTLLNVAPNAYPATRIIAKRDIGDDSPVEYVQDPEVSSASSVPFFILRLNNDDELNFQFSFVVRQTQSQAGVSGGVTNATVDTFINGLTFAFASNKKDLDTLVTREFHADVNLHKNSNVELVRATYSTAGSPSVQLDWSWKWRPPKTAEDRGGGWRNTCTFAEYDQRAHRLNPLATFSFWVHNTQRALNSPRLPSPPQYEMRVPARLRVPSSQSVQSALSDSEGQGDYREVPSPVDALDGNLSPLIVNTKDPVKVDILCQRPGDDMSAVEDGPLFRATMKALEQKTGNMRTRMKKVLKKAEAAQAAQVECNDAVGAFMEALREASASNANAVQPALEHYFEKIAREILLYEQQNTVTLQKLIIDPLSKLYNIDIKKAEAKKKDFEDESKDYYAYVSRYLGQRQDSLKEKKRIESDSKYQSKRRDFELKRFDYSSFMQDLHGGRKEQEVLSHLTRYADTQAKSYLATAKKVEEMVPQLEALIREVSEADKEFQFQRTEREEKRRTLEKSTKQYIEPEASSANSALAMPTSSTGSAIPESELARSDSNGRDGLNPTPSTTPQYGSLISSSLASNGLAPSPSLRSISGTPVTSPEQNKFKGIRDLEDRNHNGATNTETSPGQHRKEGLLWALSRPGSHVDPRGLNKQAWHKFWIVLDQGRLSEYSNWKERLDLHMEPIDLRIASVREARSSERRFCFEVITPSYKRVYQATSEDDMNNWINAINNALQSAFEGRSQPQSFQSLPTNEGSMKWDIGSVLTGKISSYTGHHMHHSASSPSAAASASSVSRRTTVGARPPYVRAGSKSYEENPSKLLQLVRDNDQGNCWCADCGSGTKTEWVSINLGIVLCIECSGIHRSLGTHISKIRSLTLDTTSFTTDIVELILQIGNRVSNMVWEAKIDPSQKLSSQATRDQRLRFITEKYVERVFVNPISSTLSHYSTADETLLASVKKNDIQGVLYALALRANPNAADRSRSTHSVFLALAAADPASPHPGSASQSTTSSPSQRGATPSVPRTVAFPIAELIVQNGGEIPSTLPAFPLSPAARLYIEQKAARNGGSGGDTLGALPNIKSPTSPTEKERDRLQKRASAGNRFAGKGVGT